MIIVKLQWNVWGSYRRAMNLDVVRIPVNACLNLPALNQELSILIMVIFSQCRHFIVVPKKRLIFERIVSALLI